MNPSSMLGFEKRLDVRGELGFRPPGENLLGPGSSREVRASSLVFSSLTPVASKPP